MFNCQNAKSTEGTVQSKPKYTPLLYMKSTLPPLKATFHSGDGFRPKAKIFCQAEIPSTPKVPPAPNSVDIHSQSHPEVTSPLELPISSDPFPFPSANRLLNRTGLSIGPWGSPLVPCSQGDFVLLAMAFWIRPITLFPVHLTHAYQDVTGCSVKRIVNTEVKHLPCSPLIHQPRHLIAVLG